MACFLLVKQKPCQDPDNIVEGPLKVAALSGFDLPNIMER